MTQAPLRAAGLWAALAVLTAAGCKGKSAAVPNPFESADRVPPPALRSVPGVDAPYSAPGAATGVAGYPPGPAPSTFAPGATTPSGYPAAAPAYSAAPGAPSTYAPAQNFGGAPAYSPGYPPAAPSGNPPAPSGFPSAAPAPGQAIPNYGPPAGGGSASRSWPSAGQVAGGDVISVPPDAGALRFASPAEATYARTENGTIPRPATERRPATAGGWISGSAPVRSTLADASPRVRMPGEAFGREPVSVAALDRGVPVAPLVAVPGAGPEGEPTPLRVAAPRSTTGWR